MVWVSTAPSARAIVLDVPSVTVAIFQFGVQSLQGRRAGRCDGDAAAGPVTKHKPGHTSTRDDRLKV
jgi:hypothetical protein